MRILGFQIPGTGGNKKKPLEKIKANNANAKVEAATDWGGGWQEPFVEMGVRGGSNQSGSPLVTGTVTPTSVNIGMEPRKISNADYDKLYKLASEHHDVSFAITNIVELAGTGLSTIQFDPTVKAKDAQKMMMELRSAANTWYDGGEPMLVNALLRQAAITGCVSGEAKPLVTLKGVGNVTLLSPKWVWFQFDAPTADWKPFQQTIYNAFGLDASIIRWSTYNAGYHALSLKTYKYIALSRDEDSPYAIPPILAALEAVCIENDMLDNMAAITRRLGLMGFLQVIVNAPGRGKNADGSPETDDNYQARIQAYLQSLEPEIEKGLSNGFVISAKQFDSKGNEVKTDFEMTSSTADTAGAAALIELIMRVTAAGLKQDPIMLGKNFSTTESLAKVVIKKFGSQLMDYQRAVAQFLEHCYTLHLRLLGYKFQWLKVTFDPPILEDTMTQFLGLNEKFKFYKDMRNQGLISQQQLANHMGVEIPYREGPIIAEGDAPATTLPPVTTTANVSNDTERGAIEFNMTEKTTAMSLSATSEGEFLKFQRAYNRDTVHNFKNAVGFVAEQLCQVVNILHPSTPMQSIRSIIRNSVILNWFTAFTGPQAATSKQWISEAYQYFRKDKAIFRGKRKYNDSIIQDASFSTLDKVIQKHFYASDISAFGKSLLNEDITTVLIDAMIEMYKEGELPMMGNTQYTSKLRGLIQNILERNLPEIMTITNTTMSNTRAIGALCYLYQEGVREFELSGSSAIVCDNCQPNSIGLVADAFDRFCSMVEMENRDVKMPPAFLLGFEKNANYNSSICCKCKILAKF